MLHIRGSQRATSAAGLSLALAATISGCGGNASPTATTAANCPGTIVIGGHTTSTGGAAVYGQSFEPALRLWADDTNKSGGILGKKVSVTFADDGFDNARGGVVATELTAKDKANFVIGPVAPGPAAVAAPVYERADILALAPTTAGPGYASDGSVHNKTMYSTAPERQAFMTVVGRYIQSQHLTKPALLVSQDTYGPSYQQATEAAFKDLGLNIVAVQGFDVGTVDLVSQVRKLRDAGADVVVPLTVATASFANFFTALDKIGWDPQIAGPYALGSAPWAKFTNHAATAAFAEYAAVTRDATTPSSATSARVGALMKDVPVFDYATETYLAGEVLKAAIIKAGSCSTGKVTAALTANAQTVMGQQVEFLKGAHLGGSAASLRMVKPLTNDPKTGLLQIGR